MKNQKLIDIKEFTEKGYLQELNRCFLHPLGLALAVSINETSGEYVLAGVIDYRDDKEGIYFDLANANTERKEKFLKNSEFINSEFEKRNKNRQEVLGFDIEPITIINDDLVNKLFELQNELFPFYSDEFFNKLDLLVESDNQDKVIEFIYENFGKIILSKNFVFCEKIFDKLISKKYTPWILLPFLTLTNSCKKEITNRGELVNLYILESVKETKLHSTLKRLL